MERPIAYMGEQPYIFVSYSHKDSELVWPIIIKLQENGFRIWYDDGISPGTEWDTNIAKHIRKCAYFIAFISRNYLNSDNCKDELSFVRELNKNRVLIYLEEVALPDAMQMRLGRLQAIYWNRYEEKKAYHKLLQSPGINTCKKTKQPEPPTPVKQAKPIKVVNPTQKVAKTSVPSTEPEIIPPLPLSQPTPAVTKVEQRLTFEEPISQPPAYNQSSYPTNTTSQSFDGKTNVGAVFSFLFPFVGVILNFVLRHLFGADFSFLFLFVGVILYFVWRNSNPRAANLVIKVAAISFVLSFLMNMFF